MKIGKDYGTYKVILIATSIIYTLYIKVTKEK